MSEINVIAPDGTPGTVPDDQLDAALADGFRLESAEASGAAPVMPEPPADEDVEVRSPDGEVGTVARSELAAALADGFSEVGPEQRYQTLGQRTATLAEGLGRGATLGLSDVVQTVGAGVGTALGNMAADQMLPEVPRAAAPGLDAPLAEPGRDMFDESAQQAAAADIAGRRQANPALAVSGELAGAVAPALLSGGVGSVGALARVTPAGQLANLATKMGTVLSARAGTALGRVGALTLTGAAEGAVDAATRRVMDDLAAGNVEITAERALDAAWDSARWGGLAAGGIGGMVEGAAVAGRGLRRVADGAAGLLSSKPRGGVLAGAPAGVVAPEAAGVADDLAPSLRQDIAEQAISDPVGAQEAMGPLTADALSAGDSGGLRGLFAKARAAEGAFESGQQGATRTIRKDLDGLLKSVDEIDKLAGIAAKRRASRAFDGWGRAVDSADVDGVFDAVSTRLGGLVAEVGEAALMDRGGLAVIKRAQQLLAAGKKTAAAKLAEGDIGAAYMAIDDVKRGLGHAQNTKNSLAQHVLRDEYDKVRKFQESEDIWGELAQAQKRVNPAWTERIRRQNDQRVGGFFVRSGEASVDPFEALRQTNDASVGSLLNQLGKAESEGTEEALRRYLRSVAIDAQTRASTWGTQELVDKAAEVKSAVDKIESSMNAVALLKRDAQGWEEIKRSVDGIPFAGAALGSGARVVQNAANAAERQTTATLYRLARGAVKQEQAVEAAVQATVRSVAPAAKRAYKPTPEAAAKVAEMNAAEAAAREAGQGYGQYTLTDVPLADIDVPPVWQESKSAPIRQALADGKPLPPIRLARGDDGTLTIEDGIHRANAALEAGHTHIPAIVDEFVPAGARPRPLPYGDEVAPPAPSPTPARAAARVASAAPATARAAAVSAESVQRMVAQAQALQDPESPESHQLEAMTLQMAAESPEFADAMRASVRRKADFIVRTIGPQTDPSDPSGTARVRADRVTAGRRERFLTAAANPTAAMERLANGRGNAEDLAVVRELTPQVHKAWVDRVIGQVQAGQIKPTVAQRQKLFATLGVPVFREQTPAYIQFYQQMLGGKQAPAEQQNAPAGPGLAPSRKPDFDNREFHVDNRGGSRADALVSGGADG